MILHVSTMPHAHEYTCIDFKGFSLSFSEWSHLY